MGRETGRTALRGNLPLLVSGDLSTEPPMPVSIRITPGPGTPRCAAVIDGMEILMSPRSS
ncbi:MULTISPECIES: hypothetical protein [unclassified Streptomyces]|uniref:hypothetical protein n=1 Tax=unclassified Streptomyces TaxID=2593676 RepID=UPI000DC79D4F|nr:MULTISPECIES: hypothetical protein [unclassified Streptomyces]AWZ07187.1 hypothetical protein DRB89_24085 [Streptomyces sp. ICC4]AWZ16810.1 hypothetical protein DRB96_36680 [Streptomyces sp. ICC1]